MPDGRVDRKRDLLCMALLAAIFFVVFADLITLANTLHVRDTALFIYPDRHVVWERARGGEWMPMWNPRVSAGQPLAANPGYEIFYPPVWLLPAFSNFNAGFNLFLIGHFLLAGLTMFALLRSIGTSRTAALFGGISWMLGGLLASFACLPLFLYASAWLPLAALFSRRFLNTRRVRDLAVAAVVLGIVITVGEAAMILQTGALLAAYAVATALRDRTSVVRAAALTAAVVAGGILVGAAQLFPALDLQRSSARGAGFTFQALSTWSMQTARPLELVYPNVFGYYAANGAAYWARMAAGQTGLPLIFSFYPGLLVAALGIAGFATRRRAWAFAAAVIGISYLVAIGKYGPFFQLLYDIGFRSVRYPEKFFTSAVFVLVIFAALALDSIDRIQKALIVTLAAIGGVAFSLYALSYTGLYRDVFARVWNVAQNAEFFAVVSRRGWLYAGVEAAILLGLLLARPKLRPVIWSACVIVFTLADLVPRLPGLMPRVDSSYYTPPAVASAFPHRAAVRMFNEAQWKYLLEGDTGLPSEVRPWFVRNALLPRLSNAWGFSNMFELDINSTALKPTTDLNQVLWGLKFAGRQDRIPLVMALTGVTHVVSPRPFDAQTDPEAIQPIEIKPIASSRYYFADQVVSSRSAIEFAQQMHSTMRWSERAAFVPVDEFTPASGRVLKAIEGDDRIDLDVESAGRAMLVIAVTPHKYWRVFMDGRPVRTLRANVAMQALEVPAGRHTIAMRYRDPVVVTGAIVSLITIIGLAVAAAFSRSGGELRSRELQPPSQH